MRVLIFSDLDVKKTSNGKFNFHPMPWINNLAEGLLIIGVEVRIVGVSRYITDKVIIKGKSQTIIYPLPHIIRQVATNFKCIKDILLNEISEFDPDILHVQNTSKEGYASLNLRVPKVYTLHGTMKEHFTGLGKGRIWNYKYFALRIIEKIVFKKIKYAIAVSPSVQETGFLLNKKIKIWQIDNAIGAQFFNDYQLTQKNSVLFIGSLTERKQVKQIITAVSEIQNCELRLIYHNYDPKYYEEILALVAEKNCEDRVTFLGFKDETGLIDEISKCLVLCLPSKYESFGMVIAEAMAIGKPVISSNKFGMPHLVTDALTGFLISPGSVEDLKKYIRLLINNKNIAKKMGLAGKNIAYSRWHPQVIAQKTLAVYNNILNNL